MAGLSRFCGLAEVFFLITLIAATGFVGAEEPRSGEPDADWEAEIQRALDADFSIDAIELPLEDFARFVHQKAGILVLIDTRALDDVGLETDVPITCQLRNISLRSALRLALHPLDLTYDLSDGALVITTPEQVESCLVTRVYDVTDLVGGDAGVAASVRAATRHGRGDELVATMTATVAPTSWDSVGGPGAMEVFRGRLMISQTRQVHAAVEELLGLLRKAKRIAESQQYGPPETVCLDADDEDPAAQRIRRALRQPISIAFDETPLEDVTWFFAEQTKVNVLLDTAALDDVGLPADLPVTFHAPKLRMEFALRHLLRDLDLTYVIRDQVLLITTPEEAEAELLIRLYPVADLLGKPTGHDVFGQSFRPAEADDLIGLVTATVDPSTWDELGGLGSIAAAPGMDVLVVAQTADVHARIADLLQRLRRAAADATAEAAPAVPPKDAPSMRLVIYDVPVRQASPPTASGQADGVGDPPVGGQGPPAPPLNQVGGFGSFPAAATDSRIIPEDQLLQLIVVLIEPNSWSRPGVLARPVPGRLLIRQTDDVHRQIERLLTRLVGWQPPYSHGSPAWTRWSGQQRAGGETPTMGGGMF